MLVHSLVVDTSTLYPHFFGLPYRRSLKSLAKSYLKRDIQTGTHDSLEDARASLELVLCQVHHELKSLAILKMALYHIIFVLSIVFIYILLYLNYFYRLKQKVKECRLQ
jgi:DNA polymerase III epsilon subunit-like protein